MKGFLVFFVAMGSIVALGDAGCIGEFQKPGWPYRGCMMFGKLYPLGDIERMESCCRCNCNKSAMQCCSLVHTPVAYDKKKCKAVFNKKLCDYEVVRKDNPSKVCSAFGHLG